ncbi:MAG: hypothetical protein Q7R35_06970, partial [Elusimicrobiota bacterium]|nr:hypothetical protein [Elusimicrobiota bacterium]
MRRNGNLYFCACLALAAAFLCALAQPARARHYYSWEKKPQKSFFIKTKIRRWQSSASAQTRSSVIIPSSWITSIPTAVKDVSIGGTTDFKAMDAPLYLFSAELQPVRGLSFEFETGDN